MPNQNEETTAADEINSMLDAFEGKESEPPAEPPVEEPPVEPPTEPPVEEPEEEDHGKETKVKDQDESDDPPPQDQPPDDKDKIIEELRSKLAEAEKTPSVETPSTDTAPPQAPPTEQDFLGEVDLDEVLNDKGSFNKLLNKVYTQGLTDARQSVGEGILRDIPNIVRANVAIVQELQRTSDKFYADNPDLAPFKKVVATVFEEVQSQNPGKPYGELLTEVGKEARRRLDLHKKADSSTRRSDKGPVLPAKKGGSRGSNEQPDVTPLQNEIAEMNKGIGR